jgi:uncharacterized membrane protein YphA (DoxX/SURF4 family)
MTSPRNRRIGRIVGEVAVWIVTAMLVLMFARAGLDKFSDTSGWARAFSLWGFPVWFRILIGVAELTAAALLILPRTAPYGALLVVAVMLGAMGTHLAIGEARHITSEVVPMTFALIIFFARRPGWARRASTRTPDRESALGVA